MPTPPASPLDERPVLAAPRDFAPVAPEVFRTEEGVTVWLSRRPTLPIVAATLVLPVGSSADPTDLPGLTQITADMLDEGAGKRSALDISTALMDLGASFGIRTRQDATTLSLVVLKKNFGEAFGIVGDVAVRPTFDKTEWKRVQDLWKNRLKKRADDPETVASLVAQSALYGPDTAYGHPVDGVEKSAAKVDLTLVKDHYAAQFGPEDAVLVVAGDITKDEVLALTKTAFAGWKSKKPRAAAPADLGAPSKTPPKVVLVDRPDAPQSVVLVTRAGLASSDARLPLLDLVNTALGGSFTSRLNQNLREDHGWTYGARSGFSESRGQGYFVARAAVETGVTGPALDEMLKELTKMAKSGLTPDELVKVRAQDRADLVQTYETVEDTAERLARLAGGGRSPTFDADASRARQAATLAKLNELAAAHVGPEAGIIVVVGPKADVLPQLSKLGLSTPAIWDAEGYPVK